MAEKGKNPNLGFKETAIFKETSGLSTSTMKILEDPSIRKLLEDLSILIRDVKSIGKRPNGTTVALKTGKWSGFRVI